MTDLAESTLAETEHVSVSLFRPARETGAPRVLLLHGLAGSGTVWQAFARELVADCALWTAELPWRADGSPSWARQPNVGSWAAQALAAVPGGADIVIAHSFSANVLLAHLDEVGMGGTTLRGMVLVSPFYRDHAVDFDWTTISYYLNDFDRILAEGIRIRSGDRLDPARQHDMALRVRDRVGPYGWIRFFDTYLGTPQLNLDRISLSCLVVGGEHDFAAFPTDSRALAARLPRARAHILPGCGHFAMAERAETFQALVTDFLANIEHWSDQP